jgi:hypothetical protein
MKSLKCTAGIHTGPLIFGLGGMGDAIICLACGKEKYEEQWATGTRARCLEITDENKEELWPLIKKARNLPGGLNELVKQPDPEFDKWLQEGGFPKK